MSTDKDAASIATGANEEHEQSVRPPPYNSQPDQVRFTHYFLSQGALTQLEETGVKGKGPVPGAPTQTVHEALALADENRASEPLSEDTMPYVCVDHTLTGEDAWSEVLRAIETREDNASTQCSFYVSDASSSVGGEAKPLGTCLSGLASLAIRTGGSIKAFLGKSNDTWKCFGTCFGRTDAQSDDSRASNVQVYEANPFDPFPGLPMDLRYVMKVSGERAEAPTKTNITQDELEHLLNGDTMSRLSLGTFDSPPELEV